MQFGLLTFGVKCCCFHSRLQAKMMICIDSPCYDSLLDLETPHRDEGPKFFVKIPSNLEPMKR